MDNDKVKGKGNEAMGGAKQKMGEWTGNEELQEDGQKQELKGKAQGAIGDVKEKARDVKDALS